MRRVVAALGVAGLALALAQPAGAQTPPVAISIFEGGGKVCNTADPVQWESMWGSRSGTIPNRTCTYYSDPIWTARGGNLSIAQTAQGLYAPGLGPPVHRGGFTFNAGNSLGGPPAPPETYCISSVGGNGCVLKSSGELKPSNVNGTGQPGFGVYAGSSHGRGYSETTTVGGGTTRALFGWDQSWATILPIVGDTVNANGQPNGGKIAGFTSSRGVAGCGDCGSAGAQGEDKPTVIFAVEGMFVFVTP